MTQEKNKGGRPETWVGDKKQDAIDRILARVATSRDSLRTICQDETLPDVATFFRWLRADTELRDQYAHAKEAQADVIADEMVDISDDATNDYMEAKGDDGASWRLNGEHIQRSRLRVETRKWLLGKLRPKVYGDKIQQEVTGANGGAVQVTVTSTQAGIG